MPWIGLRSNEAIQDKNRNEEDSRERKEEKKILESQNLQRSARERKLPRKLKDYAMLTYKEAIEKPEKDKWKKTIEKEKKSLKKNKVWTLIPIPETGEKRILSNK